MPDMQQHGWEAGRLMIEISHVRKRYQDKSGQTDALDDVSIRVERGDIFGVIGFSGAGKSTLLRMVNQLERPDQGTVTVDGTELTGISQKDLLAVRKKIGMVFQQFNLLESKTVYQNIAMPLILDGAKKETIQSRVAQLLQFVELEDKADTYVARLSGGQKQRVGIARALATSPSILLCDEATSALDPKTTESILSLLKRVNLELGITILLITHQMQVIQRICNKVAVMEQGHIVEQGPVLEVFGSPKEAVTRDFVRSVVNDQIPESIKKLILQDGKKGRIEKLNFIGETVNEPLIARICQTNGVVVNILCATVLEVQDSVICLFLLRLTGDDHAIDAIEHQIDASGVVRERLELTA